MYKPVHHFAMAVTLYFGGCILLDHKTLGMGILLLICAVLSTILGLLEANKRAEADRLKQAKIQSEIHSAENARMWQYGVKYTPTRQNSIL